MFAAVHRIRVPLRGVLRQPKRFCWGDCKYPDRREKWLMQGCSVLGGLGAASTFVMCFPHIPDMTLTEKAGLTAATTSWALVGMIFGELIGSALVPLSPVVPRAFGIAAIALISRTITIEVETKPSPELPDDSEPEEKK